MPAQDTPASDSSSDSSRQLMLNRWQALDRGWKAAFLGVIIVLNYLAGGIP